MEYEITEFFKEVKYITMEGVADKAGMNKSLLRQYATGVKNPSKQQIKKINVAIHKLGRELVSFKVSQ